MLPVCLSLAECSATIVKRAQRSGPVPNPQQVSMNPQEILRLVDTIHRERHVPREVVFESVEQALRSALRKHFSDESALSIHIDRRDGTLQVSYQDRSLSPEEVEDLVGRIGAQVARQVIIQKIREAECDTLYNEYLAERGQLVSGIIQRYDGGMATVALNDAEAILPRSEQIPGEELHVNKRIRATVYDVQKKKGRVKIVLSRTRPELVQRLFEQEVPEIADGIIEIKAIAREPGSRTKVAVATSDPRVDCVGACVGVRGNRIKTIGDELNNERIDVIPWSDDLDQLIRNALQPAEVEDVMLCPKLGRAIVLVPDDQLSLAIGRRGQNVRLASKLTGWDIDIMTREELDEAIERAIQAFSSIEGISDELSEALVGEGFLSYDDLAVIETEDLMELGGLSAEQVEAIRQEAERRAEEAEQGESVPESSHAETSAESAPASPSPESQSAHNQQESPADSSSASGSQEPEGSNPGAGEEKPTQSPPSPSEPTASAPPPSAVSEGGTPSQ